MVLRIKCRSESLRRFAQRAIFAVVPSAFATQGFAQGTTTLETIEVVTTRTTSGEPQKGFQGTPDWVYETPGPVGMITRQQLEQRTPRNSSDLFQDMPGVFASPDRQNPGTTINIRG